VIYVPLNEKLLYSIPARKKSLKSDNSYNGRYESTMYSKKEPKQSHCFYTHWMDPEIIGPVCGLVGLGKSNIFLPSSVTMWPEIYSRRESGFPESGIPKWMIVSIKRRFYVLSENVGGPLSCILLSQGWKLQEFLESTIFHINSGNPYRMLCQICRLQHCPVFASPVVQ